MVSDDDEDDDDDEEEAEDEMAESDEDMGSEEGESEIEDDMGGEKENAEGSSDDASEEAGGKKGRLVGKGTGVYKAPKLNAMAYEDAKDRKKRLKAEYERKRIGKTGLVEELKREMTDAPEEVYMGGVAKKGKASRF